MPNPVPARCLWLGCASPGPYATDKALFEHLERTHGATATAPFACRWAGCTHTGTPRTARMQHLGGHTHQVFPSPPSAAQAITETECRCEWSGCDARVTVFADVPALREHIEATHLLRLARGKRCGWAGCTHTFSGGNYRAHLWAHLPAWYKPFSCPTCEKQYKMASGLARHRCSDANHRPAKRRKVVAELVPDSDSESDRRSTSRSSSGSNHNVIAGPAAPGVPQHRLASTLEDRTIALDADLRRAGRTALVCTTVVDEDDWEFCT